MQRIHRLHFVGIGGIGMSGIAQIFLRQGHRVTGSDKSDSESLERLRQQGAEIFIGHASSNVGEVDAVVLSSAIRADNVEVQRAREMHIPVIPRAEMLAEIMRDKPSVAIAGTHGKTTTTSMLASIGIESGWDPTLIIGGKVDRLGGNARLGEGKLVIAEADESDGSFLVLPHTYGIITNIDRDHMDHFRNMDSLNQAFQNFISRVPFYGFVVVQVDEPRYDLIYRNLNKRVVKVSWKRVSETKQIGSSEWQDYSDYRVRPLIQEPGVQEFELTHRSGNVQGPFRIVVPGNHNLMNAALAAVLSLELGATPSQVNQGLQQFTGVDRRFQIRLHDHKLKRWIIDDYAHHPTEVRATLQAARSVHEGPIWVVFQPHRYSRTQESFAEFAASFSGVDRVWVTNIYSAGEAVIPGISGESLASAIRESPGGVQDCHSNDEVLPELHSWTQDWLGQDLPEGVLLLFMGAGSITRLSAEVASWAESKLDLNLGEKQ